MENKIDKIDLSFIGQSLTILISVLYLIGFVVVNSYLAKIGVYSFEIINSQYLSAGVLAAIAFAIFAFVVGRRVYNLESDYDEWVKIGYNEKKPFRTFLWASFCFVHNYIELTFGILVGVYWTSQIFFRNVNGTSAFGFYLAGLFLIDYLILWRGGFYSKFPFITLPLASAGFLSALYVAATTLRDLRVFHLLVIYVSAVVLLNIIMDTAHKRAKNKSYTFFWGAITILGFSVIFGKSFLGEIKRDIGGAEPVKIRIITKNDTPLEIDKLLKTKDGVTSELRVLYETKSDMIVELPKTEKNGKTIQNLRLNKSLVLGVLPSPEEVQQLPSFLKPTEANHIIKTDGK